MLVFSMELSALWLFLPAKFFRECFISLFQNVKLFYLNVVANSVLKKKKVIIKKFLLEDFITLFKKKKSEVRSIVSNRYWKIVLALLKTEVYGGIFLIYVKETKL